MTDRYTIGDFDVSEAFYNFQCSLKNRQHKFHLETHLHHILAASSILLITPGRMPSDLISIFGSSEMDSIIKNLYSVSSSSPLPSAADMYSSSNSNNENDKKHQQYRRGSTPSPRQKKRNTTRTETFQVAAMNFYHLRYLSPDIHNEDEKVHPSNSINFVPPATLRETHSGLSVVDISCGLCDW
ncbi:unnamed protein product [Absidia cylindrospora]